MRITFASTDIIAKKSMPVARSFSAVSNVPPVQPATRHVRTLSKNDVTDSIKHIMCVMVVQKQSITARLPTNTAMMLFLLTANTKNVPHRPGRGRGAGAADGLSRGGGGAGRPPRPRRPGGVAPHLLRPAGGGAVRHRPALPRLARPDAGRQRPPRRHRPPRRGAETAGAGGVALSVTPQA